MSSSAAISNEGAKPGERRGSPRQRLNHCVVLAFFGEDSWGKLINISERGMAFEFSRTPSVPAQVNFTFQVMGCMPMPHDASVLNESFEALGEILWFRGFERDAGAQFVDLAEKSREQIRQWLSLEASANTGSSSKKGKLEAPPTRSELRPTPESSTPAPESLDQAETGQALTEVATSESPAQAAEPVLPVTPIPADIATEKTVEAPAWPDQSEVVQWQPRPMELARTHTPVARLTLLVVCGCLAAFAVTAGLRIYMARTTHRAEAVERPTDPAVVAAEAGRAVDLPPLAASSSPGSAARSSPAPSTETAPAFQVDVQDVNGRRWTLWFVRKDSGNGDERSPAMSATRSTKHTEAPLGENVTAPRTFTLVPPNLNHPAGNDSQASNLSTEAPAMQSDSTTEPRDPLGNLLVNHPAPPPAEKPVGGMVQQARLIQSVPPVYPQTAKSSRVSGDVLVDALIDATGKVTSVKVISGPVQLQQAAIETVRQWKYEPARLDGQAVAMHLTVTVKFRLD